MSHCGEDHGKCNHTTASQTLDEMDFERGIWHAAQDGDLNRVKKLLDNHRSDPDSRDSAGYTALHYAARNGQLEVCKFLLEKGADINAVTRAGEATALSRAAFAGKSDIVEYLLTKRADPFIVDVDGRTALHRAAESNQSSICKLLLKDFPTLKDVPDAQGIKVNPDTFTYKDP